MVHPMTSLTGYVAYLDYSAGLTKGDVDQGDLFNSPFKLGDVEKSTYTSSAVVETPASVAAAYLPAFDNVAKGAFQTITVDSTEVEYKAYMEREGRYTSTELATKTVKDVKIISSAGVITFANLDSDGKVPISAMSSGCRVAYFYNNEIIPQEKIPSIKGEMKSITLLAKARRIAIYYSQIAAFQAKTDYGFDLADSLAEQAVGRLSFEIDTEIVQLIEKTANDFTTTAELNKLSWSKTLPVNYLAA